MPDNPPSEPAPSGAARRRQQPAVLLSETLADAASICLACKRDLSRDPGSSSAQGKDCCPVCGGWEVHAAPPAVSLEGFPAPAPLAAILGEALPPAIGRYTIVRLLGQGGMGAVYEAVQDAPKRTVALKVIRPGLMNHKMLRRFMFEAEVLGKLQHPGIAAIYEAGTAETAAGVRPYIAMEYVAGQRLGKYVDSNKLSLKSRLELLAALADAVHYAHTKGVIHRDLKPGNILVLPPAAKDGAPVPKILDFGLARSTDEETGASLRTETGAVLGTLNYMAPEQAQGTPDGVDTRADVYALGVIAYEVLTGQLPLKLNPTALYDALRVIREDEPTHLSVHDRSLRGDVEVIVAKAMEKDKERRYESAGAFAADIRRHLRDEPITARPASAMYQVRKFAKRHKTLVGGVAVVIVALSLGVAIASWQAVRATRAEKNAERERDVGAAAQVAAERARDDAQAQRRHAETRLVDTLRAQAAAENLAGEGLQSHRTFEEARREAERLGLPTEALDMELLECESRHPSPIATYQPRGRTLDVSPDGRTLATVSPGGKSLRFWDVVTGASVGKPLENAAGITVAFFSPSGKYLAAGSKNGELTIWQLADAAVLHRVSLDAGSINSLAFSPDERTLAIAADHIRVLLVDVATGRRSTSFASPQGTSTRVCFLPDGKRIVDTGGPTLIRDHSIHISDAATGAELRQVTFPADNLRWFALAVRTDGKRAAACDYFGNLSIFDPEAGEILATGKLPLQPNDLAYTPDGKTLLAAMTNGALATLDADTGALAVTKAAHQGDLNRCGVLPAANLCWSAAGRDDALFKVWNLGEPPAMRPLVPAGASIANFDVSPDGNFLAIARTNAVLDVVDCATGKSLLSLPRDIRAGYGMVAILPDGRRLVYTINMGAIGLLDLAGKAPLRIISSPARSWSSYITVSPDGRFAATSEPQSGIYLYDLLAGAFLRSIPQPAEDRMQCLTFTPDSKALLSGSVGCVQAWDPNTGLLLQRRPVGVGEIWYSRRMALPLGDDRVVTGSSRLFEAYRISDGGQVWKHADVSTADITATGDSRRIYTCGRDMSVRVWDGQSGDEIHQFRNIARAAVPSAVCARNVPVLVISDGSAMSLWDFRRMATQRTLEAESQKARIVLQEHPADAPSLRALGEWYAFRSAWPWAIELLEKARQQGATVSSLTLARCYWQTGNADKAAAEFRAAIARKEADEVYLQLCLDAVLRDAPKPK